ncbi:hypothetical protein ACTXT7_010922, partial [Hymenolepis weldensis]
MADNIIENTGPPRFEEIPHTSHPTSIRSEPAAAFEEGINYSAAQSIDAGVHSPDTLQDPEDTE